MTAALDIAPRTGAPSTGAPWAGAEPGAAGTVIVPFAGPTFVNDWTVSLYMGGAITRHPSLRLSCLPWFGSVDLTTSAKRYAGFVRRVVGPERPYIAVGNSQGGVVAALHALDDPYARHVVMIGAPIHGAWLSRLLLPFPAARQLTAGSALLTGLQAALAGQPGRFTSIFCPDEQLMHATSPYLPGIATVLVGSSRQLERFSLSHPEVHVTEQVTTRGRVTHTNAMRHPDVRATLWRLVRREAAAAGLRFT